MIECIVCLIIHSNCQKGEENDTQNLKEFVYMTLQICFVIQTWSGKYFLDAVLLGAIDIE